MINHNANAPVEDHGHDERFVGPRQAVKLEQRHQEDAKRQFVRRPVGHRHRVAEAPLQVRRKHDAPVVSPAATAIVRPVQQGPSFGPQLAVEVAEMLGG